MEPTLDPSVLIEERGGTGDSVWVVYVNTDGDRWIIRGTCNQCGSCEIDEAGDHIQWLGLPGTPGACRDLRVPYRLDSPIRPEGPPTWPGCSLGGEYL